jgi:hypothetical protein
LFFNDFQHNFFSALKSHSEKNMGTVIASVLRKCFYSRCDMKAEAYFFSKKKFIPSLVFAIVNALVLLATPLLLSAASINDYCLIPPYVKTEAKPNILVIMDNSRDMGAAAYCTPSLVDNTVCTDNYDAAKLYDGYFEFPNEQNGHNNQYYCYSGSKWIPKDYSTSIPAGCTTPAVYSGNLLNWATMSKYDVLQRILVGGISVSRQTNVNTLVGSSTNWTKTLVYTDSLGTLRSCKIVVAGGRVEFRDDTPGSCGYLDPTPLPVVASADTEIHYAAVMKNTEAKEISPASSETASVKFAQAKDPAASIQQPSRRLFQKVLGLFATVLDFLTPSAEAVKPLSIRVGVPPNGTECVSYSFVFTAAGGQTPYSWSQSAGTLPPGLTLSASGELSGSPTAAGTYTFTVRVTDGTATDSRSCTVIIADNSVSIGTISPLQDGYVASYYMVELHATGACGNLTWSLDPASPALPSGFNFDDSGDVGVLLNGYPTVATTFTFKARVTDSSDNVATKNFTVTINPAPVGFAVASGSPLTSAQQNSPYFIYIESAGGTNGALGTYTWSISNGTSCANISLLSRPELRYIDYCLL